MPAHEMVVIIACVHAQMSEISAHAGASGEPVCLNFSLSHRLYLYYVYASSEGSGDEYRNRVHWPILWKQTKYTINKKTAD